MNRGFFLKSIFNKQGLETCCSQKKSTWGYMPKRLSIILLLLCQRSGNRAVRVRDWSYMSKVFGRDGVRVCVGFDTFDIIRSRCYWLLAWFACGAAGR